MLFRRAYCQVAVCGASRASMMTGLLPTQTRYVDYLAKVDEDTPDAITMPQVFKQAGYTTLANGKIFHTSTDTAGRSWSRAIRGFKKGKGGSLDPATAKVRSKSGRQLFYESPDVADNAYGDGKVAEQTIADLRQLKADGRPFFLACGFIRPHLPFYAPKKYWDLYDEQSIPLASNRYLPKDAPKALGRGSGEFKTYALGKFKLGSEAFHRKMRHGYYASTSYADSLTGDVLEELEQLGLADNTIVVIWGDHGWHLGEHNFWGKHNTLHNALRIPLIVKVPGKLAGESDSLIQSVDLFPTLCELAGLEVPESVQGQSFAAVLENPEREINDSVYARFKAADALVTDRFTYSLFSNGEEMLYDRGNDPQENQNVAKNPEYNKQLKSMQKKLAQRMKFAESAKY